MDRQTNGIFGRHTSKRQQLASVFDLNLSDHLSPSSLSLPDGPSLDIADVDAVDPLQVALEVALLGEHVAADDAGGLAAVQSPVVAQGGRRQELFAAQVTPQAGRPAARPCREDDRWGSEAAETTSNTREVDKSVWKMRY